jgi:hypothetical protein
MTSILSLFGQPWNAITFLNVAVIHYGKVGAKQHQGKGMTLEITDSLLDLIICPFHAQMLEKLYTRFRREMFEMSVLYSCSGEIFEIVYTQPGGYDTEPGVVVGKLPDQRLKYLLNNLW